MAEPIKNILNERYFNELAGAIKCVINDFDERLFFPRIFDDEWENREIKQRMRHVSTVLKSFLPADTKEAIAKIVELTNHLKKGFAPKENQYGLSFELFLPDFVEQYGLDDYDTSVKAFEEITRFTSCELAVRPFIIKYPDEMMAQMLVWSKHEDQWVRRLSSEGCRPRLPWAMALPKLKEDPSPIIPVLENLKNDPSEFVRLSVANNLNDIAKDNPGIVIALAGKWQGKSKNTDWIIKHGCRSLLKQGNREALALFGLNVVKNIHIEDFRLTAPKVTIGRSLEFGFKLLNSGREKTMIRLEYGIYYQKANGSLSKKVYKISEKEYAADSATQITRKQSFQVTTTRVLHPGLHQISVIINGNETRKYDFELIE